MTSPLFLIYLLLTFLTGFSNALPTTLSTAPFSPQPSTNETWPTLPPLPPPTTLSELITSRSILRSLLDESLHQIHLRSLQNSTSASTPNHIFCDSSPTSADLIDVLAGTNWFLHQGDGQFLQTEEYEEVLQWGTAGFSVYSTPLTYAYPYRTLGFMAGAIAQKCKGDSTALVGGGKVKGEEGGVKVSGRMVYLEEYADLRVFRKGFYREDLV
ncbi:hypothetical protein B9Z19DRAFT_1063155 [Tuber borchii]|uniref:Uncharacterized protein n=1 Tax=Tuber borchii TaxID=42251 RepID=A0A2T6ZZE3_TUBBO|nr:hypothetical protein B9Z19DRAFT_1063155 [Tuber borchii]